MSHPNQPAPRPSATTPTIAPPPGPPAGLDDRHRRLARLLYAAELVRGRRVLEIGAPDGDGAAFLLDRGARNVLVLSPAGERPAAKATPPTARIELRSVEDLTRPGALSAAALGGPYDVAIVHARRAWVTTPGFVNELERLVARGGHLLVAVPSRESPQHKDSKEAVGYFELLDALEKTALGAVAMIGQSPFLGAALAPFGASDPALLFDDSLAGGELPEDYLALCGPQPVGGRPYQVVRVPASALLRPAEKPAPVLPPPPLPPVIDPKVLLERDRLLEETRELARERDSLKARISQVSAELEQRHQEAKAAREAQKASEQKLQAAETHAAQAAQASSRAKAAEQKLEELQAQLRRVESQRAEYEELIRQRQRGERETGDIAVLHEREMRALRTTLDERDAFIAELEAQIRDLPKTQERLNAERKRAEDSAQAERQARQKLAEVEGLLLRARAELKERADQGRLSDELVNRQRDVEAGRGELLVQRVELEQLAEKNRAQREELERATKAIEKERLELAQQAAKQKSERDELERALSETRRELVAAQDQIQHLHAEVERKAQLPKEPSQRLTVPAVPDAVPMAVGDIPTSPIGLAAAASELSSPQMVSQLRQRIAELETENERLKDKITDAERETWRHMKARSEAEQNAAEVREDTVRKLRDARKLASVELTRAMEDATKKAVMLREELARTEAERKEAVTQIKELRSARDAAVEQAAVLRQELQQLRWSANLADGESATPRPLAEEVARIREEGERALAEERSARHHAQQAADVAQSRVAELRAAVAALEQALSEAKDRAESEQRRVETLEEDLQRMSGEARSLPQSGQAEVMALQQDLQQQGRLLAELRAERDSLGRLLAEVEREAHARAERARQLRVRLSEREREVEALRIELSERERKIAVLEQGVPPSEEIARLTGELTAARRRVAELQAEAARYEQHSDDVVSTALRERARSVRMTETLDQATRERNQAVDQTGELEHRLREALAESDRLRAELHRIEGKSPDGDR